MPPVETTVERDAFLDTNVFAEVFSVLHAAGGLPSSFRGVFTADYVVASLNGLAEVGTVAPTILMKTSEADLVREDDVLVIQARNYRTIDRQPGEAGSLTRLILHRV